MCLKAYFFLGPFDWVILVLIIVLNIYIWKKKIENSVGCFVAIACYIVLPVISIMVELDRSEAENGPAIDNYEVAYTIFRFPVYWVIGIVQTIIFFIIKKLQKRNLDK